jgi:hypothetical protein
MLRLLVLSALFSNNSSCSSLFNHSQLRPTPKWKLVVDIGVAVPPRTPDTTEEELQMHYDLLNLIQRCTPANKNSPLAQYLPGFTSLRILLTQQYRSERENELLKSILSCFDSYRKVGRADNDIATMTARDFMALSKQKSCGDENSTDQEVTSHQDQRLLQQQQQAQSINYRNDMTMNPTGTSAGLQNFDQQHDNQNAVVASQQQLSLLGQQVYSVGASPAMQPIGSSLDTLAELQTLGLTAAQLAAILQNDAQF